MEGVISTCIGLALLFMREPTLSVAAWFLGLYLIADSFLALGTALLSTRRVRRRRLAIRGVFGMLLGLFLLGDHVLPGVALPGLALTGVAAVGILIGLAGIIQSARGAGWGAAVTGMVSIIFGYYVWRYSPELLSHFLTLLGGIIVVGGGATVLLAVRMGLRQGTPNPISVRHPLLGMLRVLALLAVMLIGLAVALPAWLLPIRHKEMKLNFWVLTVTCRIVNWILRIEVKCLDRDRFLRHTGIVFPNHVSYLDIPVLVSLEPMRFLSTAEVFRVPFIGWMADSITTIFVDRSSEKSRASVREQISRRVKKDANPPFVIFPEGRFGTARSLRPYHRGAFEIAASNSIAYLPCALRYSRPDIAMWRGAKQENFIIALWRMLTYSGRLRATVTPLRTIYPSPEQSATVLAENAQRATEAALCFEPAPTTLIKSPDRTHSSS